MLTWHCNGIEELVSTLLQAFVLGIEAIFVPHAAAIVKFLAGLVYFVPEPFCLEYIILNMDIFVTHTA